MCERLFALIQVRIKNWGVYRFDFFSMLLGSMIPLAGLTLYWTRRLQFQGVTSKGIIIYYVLVYLIEMLFSYEVAFSVEEDISTGKLNSYLLLPCHYITLKFSEYLFGALFPLVVLFLTLGSMIGFAVLPVSMIQIFFFLLFVLFGSLFHFLFFMMLGLLTVWLKNIDGLIYFLQTFTGLLAGMVVPLSFFPVSFAWIQWNPFALSVSAPSMVFLSGETPAVFLMALIGWCAVAYVLFCFVWRKAMHSYEAYGG